MRKPKKSLKTERDEANNPFLSPKKKKEDDRYIPPLIKTEQKLRYISDCKNSRESTPPRLLFATPQSATPKTPSKRTERDLKEWQRVMASPSLFYASKDTRKQIRQRGISKTPDLVLDAPNARDDFYTRLIDWSPNGNMLVALSESCYLWNKTGLLTKVYQGIESNIISSVGFSPSGNLSAVATISGQILIYDFAHHSYNREYQFFHQEELSAMLWQNENGILTGDTDGALRFWDRRNGKCQRLDGFHEDRICGLNRSFDENYLASGGNEGVVNVWDIRRFDKPLWTFKEHTAAVKAISFCPWAPTTLATGGGLDDGMLHFHNTSSGVLLKSFNAGDQICDLVWSKHYKELLTAQSADSDHSDQLVLWKYPSGEKITTLPGHTHRSLNLTMSPDGETVASLGDDESMKFWKCFTAEPGQKPLKYEKAPETPALTIR